MKAILLNKETHYYKYVYNTWTQPVLNSNGTMGGSSFAVSGTVTNGGYQPYMVFNTNTAYNDAWIAQTGQPVFTFYNPVPLRVTNIQVTNPRFTNSYAVTGGTISGSDDNSSWITIKSFSNSNTANGGVWNIDLSNNTSLYKYYRIAIASHVNDWGGFDRLNITAQTKTTVEGTAEDYDYKVETGNAYVVKEIIKEYYKYIDTPDVLVDLYASNNQSYIDSTSKHFVVSSVTAWSTTQTYTFNQPISAKDITATSAVTFIQGNAGWTVKISATTTSGETITILERDHGYGQQTTLTNTIDFNPLEQIASITIYAYCYRRSDQYCYGGIDISLTYTQRLIEPATEADYDFYEDVDVYKAIKFY